MSNSRREFTLHMIYDFKTMTYELNACIDSPLIRENHDNWFIGKDQPISRLVYEYWS